MDLTIIGLLVGGFILLVVGAEFLVRGASKVAALFGISPLVIGLTVVAYGTSTPELAVSIQAGLAGAADIAVANVVGSNIFNILLILGICAIIQPLIVAQQLVRLDVPLMIGLSVLTVLFALDGRIGMLDGILFVAGLIVYNVWAIRKSRQESAAVKAEYEQEYGAQNAPPLTAMAIGKNAAFILGGLAILVVGSRWLVNGSVALAQVLGVSDMIIGLTIVAAGTSLPEVATSVIATIRNERDIAIGNVVGSNIYNILAILGIASVVTPGGLVVAPAMLNFDLIVMTAVAFACLPIFFSGYSIARWEGAVFFGGYLAYTAYLVMDATQHDALPMFSSAMLYFVLPLVALTLAVVGIRALRQGGEPKAA
ncbi:MAG: sodium:calcium antiporter [Caldilinea sp. CFX5]|nr:sodium:calcium antiporter [Caldilinea sp. CFX5]